MAAITPGLDTSVVAPILYLISAIGNLGLAVLVVFRGRGTRGALPLSILCLSLFVWQMGEGLYESTGARHWRYMRLAASSVAPAFLFHFVLHYVRREREYGRITWLLYGVTTLFSVLTAGAIAFRALRELVNDKIWNILYVVCLFPFLAFAFFLLMQRQRQAESRSERNALNFIALGIVIGAFAGFADLTVALGSPLPPLGHLGGLACTLILAVAIFRHRLLDTDLPFHRMLVILGVASAAVALNFFLSIRVGGDRGDLLLVGTAFLIVLVLAVYRLVLIRWYEGQQQRQRLAMLGTMAAGVAHEVRNPLAAIKGAAQFVQKDLEERHVDGESPEYLKLVIDEVDRLNQVVENFLDYSRPLTPNLERVDLAPLVADMVTLHRAAAEKPVVEFQKDAKATVSADPALLRLAIGNILRNATEAAQSKVIVRVKSNRGHAEVEVEDDGPGVPADKMEQLFHPFFTTKARGTGLGLATARRIVESHRGFIGVRNVSPHGARFTVMLPASN